MSGFRHVAVVGGGFTGTLLAIRLLRHPTVRVTLIERRATQRARGVAYSTTGSDLLLNVRAAGMSAFPEDPGHFLRWLETHAAGGVPSFVPRATYGGYLAALLGEAHAAHPGRLTCRTGEVSILGTGDTMRVRLDGDALDADAVVLATGNLPPQAPPGLDADSLGDVYVPDPWKGDVTAGLEADDSVVLVGTGLTAIDAALMLDAAGFEGRILALSRRGLRPRTHQDGQPPVQGMTAIPAGPLSALLHHVRGLADRDGWRGAVDSLRPVTQRLWAGSDVATRARFLRHLRPYWDVHRHRIAPAVAARIDAMVERGQLRFAAGRIVDAVRDGDHATLRWTPRHGGATRTIRARHIVNCTGPQTNLAKSGDPLLHALFEQGAIRSDPLRLGIDVDEDLHVIGRDGRADPRLFCAGPMTRGALWEIVAVPDIRTQVATLAERLARGGTATQAGA